MLLYYAGRFLQVVGMLLLPVALAGALMPDHPVDEKLELTLLAVGGGIFMIGYLLQQVGRPR